MDQRVEKVRLQREDVVLMKPIPWNIYSSDGKILLKKGLRITSEKNLDRLMESELLRDAEPVDQESTAVSTTESQPQAVEEKKTQPQAKPAPNKPSNPFEWIEFFSVQLKKALDDIADGKPEGAVLITKLSDNIAKMSASYGDLFLGAVHMFYPQPYSLMQPIYSALLCDMTAQVLAYTDEQRASLRCAALTANLGMYTYQDAMNNQVTPLTEAQVEELHMHPYQAVQMLKEIDIEDQVWINAVAQHHERNDGSGYPAGITSQTIKPESKIISLADSYLAMISRRAYKDITQPKIALQQIYKSASDSDQSIFLAFIKILGIFPPGTYVKLANEEIAVVTKRSGKDTLTCMVSSICGPDLKLFNIPVQRDTSEDGFGIKEFYAPTKELNIDPLVIWGIKK